MLKRRMIETVGSKLKTVKTERKRRFNNSMKQKKTQFATFKIKKYMALQLCEFKEQFMIGTFLIKLTQSQKTGSILRLFHRKKHHDLYKILQYILLKLKLLTFFCVY